MLSERGLTLAEILVATAIIAIGLVALAMVIPISSYGVHEGNALSTATFFAEQRLEAVRNAAWTTTPSANDCLGLSTTSDGTVGVAPSSTTCTRSSLPAPDVSACASGSGCTTYADESTIAGYPAYGRTVRVYDCATTIVPSSSAGCAGMTDRDMRLVRVAVTYRPMSGVGGSAATATKSAVVEMVVARRQ